MMSRIAHFRPSSGSLVVLVAVVALGVVVPGVASADPPAVDNDPVVHEVPNPCRPGETHTVTQEYISSTHVHRNNAVSVHRVTLSTDDGFVGTGHQQDVIIDGVERSTLNLVMHHPDTGEGIRVHGQILVDVETGELIEGSWIPEVRCLTN